MLDQIYPFVLALHNLWRWMALLGVLVAAITGLQGWLGRKPWALTNDRVAAIAVFVMDGLSPHIFSRAPGSAVVTELWETRASPADNRGSEDAAARPFRLQPPNNGSVFRIIEYPPDKVRLPSLSAELAKPDDGSGRGAAADRSNPRHAGFHKTNSVDYPIVLSGEMQER